ncbi:virulence-associated protein E [Agrobacterium tumefaciens]|nr:virulence-associated protein E [Agrobacterium tumefaciens]
MTINSISLKDAAILLGGNVVRGGRISCPGPGHGKHDRSLSVTFSSDGTFTTNSFADDDFRECRDHVKRILGWIDEVPRPVTSISHPPISSGGSAAHAAMLRRLWGTCQPIAGTLGEVYLASRGLRYDGDGWRYRSVGNKLIAIIRDIITGEPIGRHETLLDAQGKKTGRLMYGRAAGGAVRLYEGEGNHLSIAEGIETALATGARPVWACLSASIMKGLPVLDYVDRLTVYADHDAAGVAAANEVGARWHAAGKQVELMMPADAGKDFADIEGIV